MVSPDIVNYLAYGGSIIVVMMLAYLLMHRGGVKKENQASLNNGSGNNIIKMDYESTVDRLHNETRFSAWSLFLGLVFSGLLILSASIDGITNYLAVGDAMYFIDNDYKTFIQGGVAFSATAAFLFLGVYYFGFAANKRSGFFSLGSAWILLMWLAVGAFSGFMSFCTMSQAVDSKSLPDWEIAQLSQLYSDAARVSRDTYNRTELRMCLQDETCKFIKNEIKNEWTGYGGRAKSCGPACKKWLGEYEIRIQYILGDDWDLNKIKFYGALEAAARGDRSLLPEAVQIVPSPVLDDLSRNGMSVKNLLNPELGGVMDYFIHDVFSNQLTIAGGAILVLITMCMQAIGANLLWTEVLQPVSVARNKLRVIKICYTALLDVLDNHYEQQKTSTVDEYSKLIETRSQPMKNRDGSCFMVIKNNNKKNGEDSQPTGTDLDEHFLVITHSFINSGVAFYRNRDLCFHEDLFSAAISLARKELKKRDVCAARDLLESVNADVEAARKGHQELLDRYQNEISNVEIAIGDRQAKLEDLERELEQTRIKDQNLLDRFQKDITDIETAMSEMETRLESLDLELQQAREHARDGVEVEKDSKIVEVEQEIENLKKLCELKKLDRRILMWITSGVLIKNNRT